MRKFLAYPLAVIVLTGCSTNQNPDIRVGSSNSQQQTGMTVEQANEFVSSNLEACSTFFGLKTAESEQRAKRTFWLMVSGLMAGSVIGPALTSANAAANAPLTTALSGFSGATVAAIGSANSVGMGYQSTMQGLLAVGSAIKEDYATALDQSKQPIERVAASARAKAACENPYIIDGFVPAEPA